MKTLRTKVILSAFVLLFALVATIGSTYAWFTVSSTVNVESMQLNVKAVDNLLILIADDTESSGLPAPSETLDLTVPSNYKSSVTSTDVQGVYDYTGGGIAPWTLYPVTALQTGYVTKDAKALNSMSIGEDTNLVRNLTATSAQNSSAGNFIEFKFWLYLQSNDGLAKNITLSDLSITSSDDAPKNNVVNAVRIAAWTNDNYSVSGSGPYLYTFEDDVENAVIYGIDNDYNYAFISTLPGYSTTAGTTDPLVAFTAGTTEFNALTQIDTLITIPTTDGIFGTTAINSVSPETPTLVTVRIYVEGWDADTTNDINSAFFNISFSFSIL